ncbi:MAG TPA: hypothetical protein DCM40_27150 [Maribacter sp.]|nr:hypothetical protein [Maribacter sp.]
MTQVANNSLTPNTEETNHPADWEFTSEEPEWIQATGRRYRLENGKFFMEEFYYEPDYEDLEDYWNDHTDVFSENDLQDLKFCDAPPEVILAAERLLENIYRKNEERSRRLAEEQNKLKTHTIQVHPDFVKMATEYFEERGEDITQYISPMIAENEVGQ